MKRYVYYPQNISKTFCNLHHFLVTFIFHVPFADPSYLLKIHLTHRSSFATNNSLTLSRSLTSVFSGSEGWEGLREALDKDVQCQSVHPRAAPVTLDHVRFDSSVSSSVFLFCLSKLQVNWTTQSSSAGNLLVLAMAELGAVIVVQDRAELK